MPTMQKVHNTKVVNPVKIYHVQYIDETVKDPSNRAEADEAEDAERTERNTLISRAPQLTQST